MNANEREYGMDELVKAVIGAAYEVSNAPRVWFFGEGL
jgi:hypothetical protein